MLVISPREVGGAIPEQDTTEHLQKETSATWFRAAPAVAPDPTQESPLPTCPEHRAPTHRTGGGMHHVHRCLSAQPPRTRPRPRQGTSHQSLITAVMTSTAAFASSASPRPLGVLSYQSPFPHAAGIPCTWSAWRSTGRKLPTCCAHYVATAWPCRIGFRANPPCGMLSVTTGYAHSLLLTRPNPAATRRRGAVLQPPCGHGEMSGRPSLSDMAQA